MPMAPTLNKHLSLGKVLSLLLLFLSGLNFARKLMLSGCVLSRLCLGRPGTVRNQTLLATAHRRLRGEQVSQRILYTVTSIAEFDTGRRETTKGYDRFSNTLVPIVNESISSMLLSGYDVDLYLITHYSVSDARYRELSNALPPSVGLQVWESATPLGYASEKSQDKTKILEITRALARQHRYVVKDKISFYDIFVNFEDDMLIRGDHVDHYFHVSTAIHDLHDNHASLRAKNKQFYGPMKARQLRRLIPGFMRVEVALDGFEPQRENLFEQIPLDFEVDGVTESLDPKICCHVSKALTSERIPASPDKDELFFWETSIDALGVRKMPNIGSDAVLDWVMLLGGANNENFIGDYWSGRGTTAYFGNEPRPDRKKGRYISNQGGWMATKRQLFEWHEELCQGGFLPPYDAPDFKGDGLVARSVEYWSGGIQIIGIQSCSLQRIMTLDPVGFSKQLLYHTSNNKQRQDNVRHKFSGRSINQFWSQLNTIRKNAEKEMERESRND